MWELNVLIIVNVMNLATETISFNTIDLSTKCIKKTPTRKIPTHHTPPPENHPGKFPPRKFPPRIFPPMFLNIPTHVFNFFVFLLLSPLSVYIVIRLVAMY